MARLFHKAHVSPATNSLIVAHDDDATSTIFGMSRLFFNFLPEQVKPAIKISNSRELLFQEPRGPGGLNSWIKAQTAGWRDIGRGKTIHHLLCDEIAMWHDHETATDGLFEAVPDIGDTTILLVTTPRGIGTWAYNVWQACKAGESDFEPVFLPWYLHDEYRTKVPPDFEFSREDYDFKEEYGLDWEQTYWYKRKLQQFELKHPGRGLRYLQQEYGMNDFECWQSAGHSAFPDSVLEWIYRNHVSAPEAEYEVINKRIVRSPGGRLRVWELPKPGVQYAIGVDTAAGVGGDFSVICVVAYPGYRQVAEWADCWTNPKALADIIAPIGNWYNEAIVAVEINGSGLMTNTILWEQYTNLYRWEVFDKRRNAETEKLGWETTYKTKELLVDHANSLLTQTPPQAVVRSDQVLSQMKGFRASGTASGMTVFESSGHDDHLMAWLIAMMCCWRKIAKYDQGEDSSLLDSRSKIPDDQPYLYDSKVFEILNGEAIRKEQYNDWMAY
jgi:hypothetical protein